jgi:hypothetical protein
MALIAATLPHIMLNCQCRDACCKEQHTEKICRVHLTIIYLSSIALINRDASYFFHSKFNRNSAQNLNPLHTRSTI